MQLGFLIQFVDLRLTGDYQNAKREAGRPTVKLARYQKDGPLHKHPPLALEPPVTRALQKHVALVYMFVAVDC